MFVGTLHLDLLLPDDSRSLKVKRGYVRPVVAALRRLDVAVAEVGALDLYGRAEIGVSTVSASASQVRDVLVACEKLVADRPELTVLAAQQRLHHHNDD